MSNHRGASATLMFADEAPVNVDKEYPIIAGFIQQGMSGAARKLYLGITDKEKRELLRRMIQRNLKTTL
ncbi:hypothetical protein [Vibrio phage vB_VpaP_M9]|nr:hypothetical protein [Vibrio phage vB_VpaP_M83]USL89827.1 hypothetical protein [Vibrio phage vB_VpaP_M9]